MLSSGATVVAWLACFACIREKPNQAHMIQSCRNDSSPDWTPKILHTAGTNLFWNKKRQQTNLQALNFALPFFIETLLTFSKGNWHYLERACGPCNWLSIFWKLKCQEVPLWLRTIAGYNCCYCHGGFLQTNAAASKLSLSPWWTQFSSVSFCPCPPVQTKMHQTQKSSQKGERNCPLWLLYHSMSICYH